jgi:sugar phosphate isomerase/epimerase
MTDPILSRVSYHAAYDASILEALQYARLNGFAGIQLAVESPHLAFDQFRLSEIETIKSLIQSNGTYVNLHAPDEVASLFQCNQFLRQGVMNYYRSLFDFAAKIGSLLVTLHAGAPITFATDTSPEVSVPEQDLPLYRDAFNHNLDELVDLADRRFILCVENHYLDDFTLAVLKPYLESNKIALCWDLAKSYHKPRVEQFFWDNLDKIKQVHIHDARRDRDGVYHRHRVIGTGEIDFASYLAKLRPAEVMDYCIEVRPREKAKESLEALRKLVI